MQSIAVEVLLIFLLILVNGVFALAEIAIVSSRGARLQRRADEGDQGALVALQLARAPTDFLSTVQIGITLVGILAGAFGGATVAQAIAQALRPDSRLAPYADAIGLSLVVVVIAYFSLVLGELAPKRLALNDPERMAARVARPMRFLSRLMAPVVQLLSQSTDVLLRLFGVRVGAESPVTPEEIAILMEQGATAGMIEATEQDIAESALFLGERRLSSLITPRMEIVWIDLDWPIEQIRGTILTSPHAYFPVAHGNLDELKGIVRGRDVLAQLLDGTRVNWSTLLREPLSVPENQTVLDLLQHFKRSGQQLAIVIDEYGGVQGLITLTDVLEVLVGALAELPGKALDPPAVRKNDGSWLLDGRLTVREFAEALGLRPVPNERGYDTLGGFVMAELARVPTAGQHFDYAGWHFQVIAMDGHRVERVLAMDKTSSQAS